MKNYLDIGSAIVVVVTFILFAAALFTKGFTHDLFLEIGVLLVSVKIIMMAHKNEIHIQNLRKELKEIKIFLQQNK
jgi:hypothetical protein